MTSLFGVPIGMLTLICAVAFVAAFVAISGFALTHRILFKLGIRHIPRRPGRTALIVFGLMLGTVIISAALNTGDTMAHTVRSSTLKSLGNIDEIISTRESEREDQLFLDTDIQVDHFPESLYLPIASAAFDSPLVDGVAPAIIEIVAVQNTTSRQNEPRVTVFASDPSRMEGFGQIKEKGRGAVSLADLAPGEVYLNGDAADELKAEPGHQLLTFAAGQVTPLSVKAIVEYKGTGTEQAAMLMSLSEAQKLLDREGQIKYVLISNRGDGLSGVRHTQQVTELLEPVVGPLGLAINPSKSDSLDFAETLSSAFVSVFVAFGTFSIIAGFMLIFLIFVMLAAERKSEMGISRAIGAQRSHLVQMFLLEGMLYDLIAAAIGAFLGLAVAYGMVFVMARAFASFGVDIEHDLRLQSLVLAYTLGMLITFVVVTISAWRVSLLNIVTAIRDLPDPVLQRGSRLTTVLGVAALALALLMTPAGLSSRNATLFNLGISLGVISLIPLLRRLGLPDRTAYTAPGIALVVWWLLPFDTFDFILPDFNADISIFIFSGVMVVTGAVWVVVYNSDLLLALVSFIFGRFRLIAPALKTAIAYPLTSRFRTGMTMAMFTLVVFTLVVMATVNSAFMKVFSDEEAFGGGFDVRATSVRINPIPDMRAALDASPDFDLADFEAVAAQSFLSLEARQVGGREQEFHSYPVRGLDGEFLANATYGLSLIAEGYSSDQEVWQAIARNHGLAVIDREAVPSRSDFDPGPRGEFQLEGFHIEDDSFSPVQVELRDPQSGQNVTVTIIGVMEQTSIPLMFGISTSQETVQRAFGEAATTVIHLFKLREGVNAKATATRLESTFLMNGLEAEAIKEQLEKVTATQLTFNYLLQGFMGLGLVVGVSALGVISARAVVERRQQIGVLRAIGFQRWMVQLVFLMESSFIALSSIIVGLILGLIISYNVVDAERSTTSGLSFTVPWLNLAIIFLITYAVSLAATFLPARRAASVLPAEALRYE
ncbi:MAG TPA: FtsX-like permease family protein [Dehalococcoidia bacterium]|nr:FtsX-like permease family protein [Dehalococcoidia bacterium]